MSFPDKLTLELDASTIDGLAEACSFLYRFGGSIDRTKAMSLISELWEGCEEARGYPNRISELFERNGGKWK
jgi:hypothetical protein